MGSIVITLVSLSVHSVCAPSNIVGVEDRKTVSNYYDAFSYPSLIENLKCSKEF